MPKYTYNGVTVTATRRRPSSRDDKKYERTVTIDGTDYLVHYGDPNMEMQRDNPERRANFLSRHSCDTKRDPRSPGFWACLDWERTDEKSYDMDENENDLLLTFGGEIKALGDGRVGGYLVRFTDADSTDLEGDYFDAKTDFGIETGDRLPVYYNHGLDSTLKRRRIGRATVEIQDVGVWLESQLEMRDEYERAVYAMVEKGKVGWSSGSMPHLVEREPQKSAQYIKSWPLGEASITPTPAAGPQLTRVQPLKTWASQNVTLDLKASGDGATVGESVTATGGQTITVNINLNDKRESVEAEETEMAEETKNVNVNTGVDGNVFMEQMKTVLGGFKMEVIDPVAAKADKVDELSAKIEQVLKYMQDTPAVRKSGYFTEDGGAKDKNVKSFGDFLLAVRRKDYKRLASVYGSRPDYEDGSDATKDLGMDSGGGGGYLVPTDYTSSLLQISEQTSPILSRVQRIPVNRPAGEWPALDQYITPSAGVGNTAMSAGVNASITSEGGTLTETEPGFEMLQWRIHKIGGFTQASNELIADSPLAIEALLRGLFNVAVNAKKEFFILRGNGAGQPLGILNAAAVVNVTPATNNLFSWADVATMQSRFKQIGTGAPVWLMHPSVLPDIYQMEIGTSGTSAWVANLAGGQGNSLNGYQMITSEHLPQANNSGNVLLADLFAYVMWEREAVSIAFSEHYGFVNDLGTWRFTQRMDGKPWLKAPITLADPQGSYTVAPFVIHND